MMWAIWFLAGIYIRLNKLAVVGGVRLLLPVLLGQMNKIFIYLDSGFIIYNNVNLPLIFLIGRVTLLALCATWQNWNTVFAVLVLTLCLALSLCFISRNLLIFYVFFEASLLPILFIIITWGYQPERIQAGIYIVIYTVAASLPLLVGIIYLRSTLRSLNVFVLSRVNTLFLPVVLCFFSFFAFFVKLPVYGLHIWLPKAHVEAPLAGSILLAGVLLKLGGYGLFLFGTILALLPSPAATYFLIIAALWGGVLAALLCFSQVDIKALIAYRSVVHIRIVVIGYLSGTSYGYIRATVTIMGHGWASSGLFLLAYITYTRAGSRRFLFTKGILNVAPALAMLWFIFCRWNIAAPPTLNLLGELSAIPASFAVNIKLVAVLLVIIFLSVGYNMYIYSLINHGSVSAHATPHGPLQACEYFQATVHLLPLFFLFNVDFFTICRAAGGRLLLMSIVEILSALLWTLLFCLLCCSAVF